MIFLVSIYVIAIVAVPFLIRYENDKNKDLKIEHIRTLCKESYKSGQFNQAFYGGNEWLYKNDSIMIDSMIVRLFE